MLGKHKKFNNIILTARHNTDVVRHTLHAVIDHLLQKKVTLSLESHIADWVDDNQLLRVEHDQLRTQGDLLLVVGGDGSLLAAARRAVEHNLPILGINRGNLGFLADITPDALEQIDDILQGEYDLEKRFLLDASLTHQQEIATGAALNDVVLHTGELAQMLEFVIKVDDKFVCKQRADGLIIATPTGSTAYALSGGGPILHPSLQAIALIPMFPHTLSSRPIVLDADSKVEVQITDNNRSNPCVSCDGTPRTTLPIGGTLTVKRKSKELTLVHPKSYHYFDTLRSKLDWGNQR